MPKKLEFFYDCSSPWTYLAFTKIEDVARRHDAELIWRPILVGGLFNTVNPSVYESRSKPVPVKEGPRRAGDPPVLVASSAKIQKELGWRPRYTDIGAIVTFTGICRGSEAGAPIAWCSKCRPEPATSPTSRARWRRGGNWPRKRGCWPTPWRS